MHEHQIIWFLVREDADDGFQDDEDDDEGDDEEEEIEEEIDIEDEVDADDPVQAQPDETQGAELLEMEYCCFEVDMAQEAKGEELLPQFKTSNLSSVSCTGCKMSFSVVGFT